MQPATDGGENGCVPIRERFVGRIAGVGSTSGVRIVVGRWDHSPWGPFADAMIEQPDGHRVLVVPDQQARDFITATYTFDEVVEEPIVVCDHDEWDPAWQVESPSLSLGLVLGPRTPLGWALRPLPGRVATAPAGSVVTDPVARMLLRGVRTRGTAGQDRREWYGATDVRAVTAIDGAWRDLQLGTLAPVDPPCRFGFSSTPRRPSVTSVVTTIERRATR